MDSPDSVFRGSPVCVFSEEGYSCALPFEAHSWHLVCLSSTYGRRTVRALVPTAKAFGALSAHVAGAADSGNNDRCVVFWSRSIAFWRSPAGRGEGGSYPHSRLHYARGLTGVVPSTTRGRSARRIQVSE